MPISWEGFERANGKSPPAAGVREQVEREAADLLGLPPEAAGAVWGAVIGWGCSSVAVVRVAPGVPHRFLGTAPEVVVKVFRTAAWKSMAFQADHVVGRDLPRVQCSLAAEVRPCLGGKPGGTRCSSTSEAIRWNTACGPGRTAAPSCGTGPASAWRRSWSRCGRRGTASGTSALATSFDAPQVAG